MKASRVVPMLLAATLVVCAAALPRTAPAAARHVPERAHAPARSLLQGLELYQLDSPHSPIGFSVAWMGLSKVRGSFDDCAGTIVLDTTDLTRSSVSIVARTASLHTGNAQRDKDLKGPDWFDVATYPTALFRSTSIARDGDRLRMRGTLTIHGVTHEVEVPVAFLGRLARATHEVRVGFEGDLVLHRRDYGIVGPARFNALTEMGKAMISDDVDLPLAIEGWRAGARDTLPDPVADSLARRMTLAGFATVARECREARAHTPDSLVAVNEAVLNGLGYALLDRGQPEGAVNVFQLEAEFYPRSEFPLTGLSQAYATLGDSAHAVECGARAVAMNPNALRAREVLRRVQP